jgi:hypothetical protein
MDKACPLRTPMVVRALEKDTNLFMLIQEGEEVLGAKYSYLSAIGALMYLATNTRPDIAFIVNGLARYSATPTIRTTLKISYNISMAYQILDYSLEEIKILV